MKKKININQSPSIPYWLCLLSVLICFDALSQTQDTTAKLLNEVLVLQTKQQLIQPSKKSIELDSLITSKYSLTSLAELLASQSAIHVKSYGNMNIATTSMRGGNANHTALLWNGLNIQNPMLGQTDLSLIPNFLFDNVSLEYGGGSALWGSGAIGGSIHLQNKAQFNKGFNTQLQLSSGSFGSQKIATAIQLSYKKIVSNTKLYFNRSNNNYPYKDTTDKENPNKQIQHADYVSKGLMQELSFLLAEYHKVEIYAWYNSTDRNLPSYSSFVSKKNQEDKNFKVSAHWKYSKRQLNSTTRLAYFNDQLNYNDSIANIYSNSKSQTVIVENDNIYTLNNHRFNVGANYTSYLVETKDYDVLRRLNKLALFATYQWRFWNSKCNYNLSVRKEFSSQTLIPFTGNTGIQYHCTKYLTAKANGSRSYRQPTLNDLYWNPGGNSNLKPEDSYEADGSVEFKITKQHVSALIEGSYFNRQTTNWIMWLPTDKGYWSPINIAKVYSRGTETKTELAYFNKEWLVKLIVNTSYVLSTNEKSVGENDQSVGRQLIYTPRYSGQATLVVKYRKLAVLCNQSYTGYRFISSDNTSWLNPYYVTNIRASYGYEFTSLNMEVFGNLNNLLNKNYAVVANMPMPMRNFEIGITMKYHKSKK